MRYIKLFENFNETYKMYSGISKDKWETVWKNKNLTDRLTNVTNDLDFAFDYSYDFNTGNYDDIAIEIDNIPIDAFVSFRDNDYVDDDDFETMNDMNDSEKRIIIEENSLFLVNLYPYKDKLNIKLKTL